MDKFLTLMKYEVLSAKRERLPQILLFIFLVMTALSCFIGWATNHTVTNVYNEAVRQGITKATNPFTGVTPLFYARNTVIYIVLIGALLAIILGVQSIVRERKARTSDLLLSRPIPVAMYLAAKLAGVAMWLLLVLIISAIINWASIGFISHHVLSLDNTLHLSAFYGLAWLFLLTFITLGMLGGIYARKETSALLVPVIIWSAIVFVIPQLGTAEHPVSLLNPVPAHIASHGFFFQVNQTIFGPLSLTEHFKTASGAILHYSDSQGSVWKSLAGVGAFALTSIVILLITSRSRLRSDLYE